MSLFKRAFGHERSASGKSLDRLVLSLILIAVAVGFETCSETEQVFAVHAVSQLREAMG